MIDRYRPLLDELKFTDEEQDAIRSALATDDPWGWSPGGRESALIASVKVKVRDHLLLRQRSECCYCRVGFHGSGPFMIDREHVLPKSKYTALSYTTWNLGIACKRCNIEYKKRKTDFLVNETDVALFETEDNYRFIHPNFDLYVEHLGRFALQCPGSVLVKYKVVGESEKGRYTYEYFNLRGLEIDSFDEAQGFQSKDEMGEIASKVRSLAKSFGQ